MKYSHGFEMLIEMKKGSAKYHTVTINTCIFLSLILYYYPWLAEMPAPYELKELALVGNVP